MSIYSELRLISNVIFVALICLFQTAQAHAGSDACSEVKLNGSGVWYPVSMRQEASGTLNGVFPDLGREILTSLHVNVAEGPDLPWNRVLVLLEKGQIDVLAGAYKTDERLKKYGVSRPVMQEEVGIFIRKSLESRPQSLKDLIGLRGVAPFGASFGEEFENFATESLSIDRQPFDDFKTYMRLLMEDKADYLVIARQDGVMMIDETGAVDLVEVLPWPAAVNTLHFLFSRATPCIALLEPFNEALTKRIDAGALKGLLDSYQMSEGDG
ncbi:substrate-binding periplasmic protein [Roseibium sediminicola]|uniref:Transporter substrate-binding domain-containing protein n=1 Tax=Roseibium sediminicola TaxID=2933272 RepID=A0ABT0GXY7_9HYPH|nr:transporter substrate-binding domain-containing protein [Roseibium sp. CAU 1639]MCK7614294.1 transporter substrate-binding domain-containing protein [Roseibium sp. CAU 1639]